MAGAEGEEHGARSERERQRLEDSVRALRESADEFASLSDSGYDARPWPPVTAMTLFAIGAPIAGLVITGAIYLLA